MQKIHVLLEFDTNSMHFWSIIYIYIQSEMFHRKRDHGINSCICGRLNFQRSNGWHSENHFSEHLAIEFCRVFFWSISIWQNPTWANRPRHWWGKSIGPKKYIHVNLPVFRASFVNHNTFFFYPLKKQGGATNVPLKHQKNIVLKKHDFLHPKVVCKQKNAQKGSKRDIAKILSQIGYGSVLLGTPNANSSKK